MIDSAEIIEPRKEIRKLTTRQAAFANSFAQSLNGSDAAKEAYGVTTDLSARVLSSRNLKKPHVRETVLQKLAENKSSDSFAVAVIREKLERK